MTKHELGEQWIEVVDGKQHMVKAVEGVQCTGCKFSAKGLFAPHTHFCNYEAECPVDNWSMIVKDFGIINEDGLLPCPFCGEYPVVQPENSWAGFGCHCDKCKCAVSGLHESMQEVMDEWNRRA